MKLDLRIIFLIAALASLISVLLTLYKGEERNAVFWIAVLWIFLGPFFYYTFGKERE